MLRGLEVFSHGLPSRFPVVIPSKQTKRAKGTVGDGEAGKKAKATQHAGGQSVSEKS